LDNRAALFSALFQSRIDESRNHLSNSDSPVGSNASVSGRIVTERHGAIAELTLHNTDRRNALSEPMWRQLAAFCRQAKHDHSLRSVIVSGAGDVFSAGADISGFEVGRTGSGAHQFDELVETTLAQFEELPQLSVAAIAGPCMGAGASLACACDLRVCEREAVFAVPAARLGLGYDPRGIARIRRVFGENIAKELLLLAARISAQRAYELGVAHRLVEPGQALQKAREIAEQGAALAPLTQSAAKAAIRELGSHPPPSEALLQRVAAADASEDYAEGRAAFAEKRQPNFKGR
jgi:enoyl-CoA hydratase